MNDDELLRAAIWKLYEWHESPPTVEELQAGIAVLLDDTEKARA